MSLKENPPTVASRAVALLAEIKSHVGRMDRAPESDQYRKGWREGLTSLVNSREAGELLQALEREGWQAPRVYWIEPPAPATPPETQEDTP